MAGPDPKELHDILRQSTKCGLNLTVEGDITDFLGVQIDRIEGAKFRLSQPHLIDDILKELQLEGEQVSTKSKSSASSQPLMRHPTSDPFDGHFDYRRVVGKLNYLEKCSRPPDISSAVHQCARFVANPKVEHGKALKWIERYLVVSRDKEGINYDPRADPTFEVYVDVSFCNNWEPETAEWDGLRDNDSSMSSGMGFKAPDRGGIIDYREQIYRDINSIEGSVTFDGTQRRDISSGVSQKEGTTYIPL